MLDTTGRKCSPAAGLEGTLEQFQPDSTGDAVRLAHGIALRPLAVAPLRRVAAPCSLSKPPRPQSTMRAKLNGSMPERVAATRNTANQLNMFSAVVASMYAAAGKLSATEFSAAVIASLRMLISFDGVAIGIGGRCIASDKQSRCSGAYQYRPVLVESKRSAGRADPVLSAVSVKEGKRVHITSASFASGSRQMRYASGDTSALQPLRHILRFVDRPNSFDEATWIVMHRRFPSKFEDHDAVALSAIWPHLKRAFEENFARELDADDVSFKERALALVSRRGRIVAADKKFMEIVDREWPAAEHGCVPPLAMSDLLLKKMYRGKQINIVVRPHLGEGTLVCQAVVHSFLDRLGPSERVVANYLRDGLGYKEIALKMGNSPNTVRTQISRIYKKLEIHDKAGLARLLVSL